MEWVETTGRTVEEAKDAALDQLGVDDADAEFEVLAEPKSGLFGRLRQEARVRARVRPNTPRPKVERKTKRRRSTRDAGDGDQGATAVQDAPAPTRAARPAKKVKSVPSGARAVVASEGSEMVDVDEPTVAEQSEQARGFVHGLVETFELTGTVGATVIDEDTIEVAVTGDDLGLLIGPKGTTLGAVQELTRTVVSRSVSTGRSARIHVDVAGYRERRRAALAQFTEEVAAKVLATGASTALEPMNPADRKVVH
ncbi:MAG: Jag N-terminal domain-containing protein, partial [Actinomycetota bacterium]|nr:Jag N-terminal domain-containing protein [Actinomycetota bacterium]